MNPVVLVISGFALGFVFGGLLALKIVGHVIRDRYPNAAAQIIADRRED